jgi:hypothetical protein
MPMLTFERWKSQLEEDCRRAHKSLMFNSLGDNTLQLLWHLEVEPTARALARGAGNINISPLDSDA